MNSTNSTITTSKAYNTIHTHIWEAENQKTIPLDNIYEYLSTMWVINDYPTQYVPCIYMWFSI